MMAAARLMETCDSSYNEAHFRKEGSGTQTLNGELKLDNGTPA